MQTAQPDRQLDARKERIMQGIIHAPESSAQRPLRLAIGIALTISVLWAPIARAQSSTTEDGPRRIAEEAYIFGLPLVMNYGVMYAYAVDKNSGQFKAPFNEIKNEARVFTYKDTAVVTPNSDTPYSILWMDLRAEPIVLSVPQVEKNRYYVVQLVDGSTYNYGYIGSRATGNEPGEFMVVGPHWQGETPKGIKKVFRSGSDFSLAVYRTQLFGPEDMPKVVEIQSGYKVRPLSVYLGTATPKAEKTKFHQFKQGELDAEFFRYLDYALRYIPPAPNETEIRAELAKIGVGTDDTFEIEDLPIERQRQIVLGMKDGEAKIQEYLATQQTEVNGWKMSDLAGNSAFIDGDWLKRAAAAKAGIYGNSAIEATYPFTKALANGDALDGSEHDYTLTFAADQYPPVNAFWSLTMYDGRTQLLIENPIDRYLINSPMLPDLKKNADGSLTIYIQNESPGADKQSNWLPAPDGPIYLVMRLYWPKTEPPSVLPPGQGSWEPPAIRVVR